MLSKFEFEESAKNTDSFQESKVVKFEKLQKSHDFSRKKVMSLDLGNKSSQNGQSLQQFIVLECDVTITSTVKLIYSESHMS